MVDPAGGVDHQVGHSGRPLGSVVGRSALREHHDQAGRPADGVSGIRLRPRTIRSVPTTATTSDAVGAADDAAQVPGSDAGDCLANSATCCWVLSACSRRSQQISYELAGGQRCSGAPGPER